MGFSPDELPFPGDLSDVDADHPVTVSGFFLDRFEISVGRFANYAREYTGPPAEGAGEHPWIARSGWQTDWNRYLPVNQAALLELVSLDLAAIESPDAPIRVSWFLAFAFCIWDGGRLPTEAEWEFAAAGGAANFAYPWGGEDPALVERLREADAMVVGKNPAARGLFGHDDLAGGVQEWVYDWHSERFYIEGGLGCHDCANLLPLVGRVVRGARDETCCTALDTEFRAAARHQDAPNNAQGARCARDPR